jgi:hypothetical protein
VIREVVKLHECGALTDGAKKTNKHKKIKIRKIKGNKKSYSDNLRIHAVTE